MDAEHVICAPLVVQFGKVGPTLNVVLTGLGIVDPLASITAMLMDSVAGEMNFGPRRVLVA